MIILYLKCFLVAIIGLSMHVALKIRSLQQKAKAGNYKFNWKDYFKEDWLRVFMSVCGIAVALIILDEDLIQLADKKWKLLGAFLSLGYMGSDIIYRFFGVVSKRINSVIDEKTNRLSDIELTGVTDTVNPDPKPPKP
jgi:hypothetical protein